MVDLGLWVKKQLEKDINTNLHFTYSNINGDLCTFEIFNKTTSESLTIENWILPHSDFGDYKEKVISWMKRNNVKRYKIVKYENELGNILKFIDEDNKNIQLDLSDREDL